MGEATVYLKIYIMFRSHKFVIILLSEKSLFKIVLFSASEDFRNNLAL